MRLLEGVWVMSAAASPPSPVLVPEQLAEVPAGALLAGLLEDVEVEAVSGQDTVEVMLAEYRVWCRQTARFYRAVLETGLRRPLSIDTVERVDNLGEFAAEEARAALVWSRSRAERTVGFAFDIFHRLPLLGATMLAGRLDEPRARAFVDWTEGLTSEQAHAVCAQLLGEAARLTVGELIERIKRACLAIDPDWAEKKYREAVKNRRVRGFLGPDGTGTLTGQSQPAERVIAACERIDALARACKRAGDRRKIDFIRSDLFLGLTDGTLEGLGEPEIIDYVLAHPCVLPGEDPDGNTSEGPGSSDGPSGSGEPGGGPRLDGPGCVGDGGNSVRGRGGPGHGPDQLSPSSSGAGDRGAGDPGPGRESPGRSGASTSPEPVARATRARSVPELRMQLGTLLGLNGEPAEVPGWGYVPAWLARDLVAQMHCAEWRYAVCDRDGHVIDGGLITARSLLADGVRMRRDTRRGGIVEIALRADEPARLVETPATREAEAAASWMPVLAELARSVAAPRGAGHSDERDATRRTAGAVLRRWIQQRDRRCVHPCCRVPASKADQDHRLGFAQGGPTTGANLSAPCRHDHRLKDEGQWAVSEPEPGLTVWASPLGRRYESRPPPAIPRPIVTRARENRWELAGNRIGQPDGCACVLLPCRHDEEATVVRDTEIEDIAGADEATVETDILDGGEPPF